MGQRQYEKNQKILDEINLIGNAIAGLPHREYTDICADKKAYKSLCRNVELVVNLAALCVRGSDNPRVVAKQLERAKEYYKEAKKLYHVS